MCTMPVRTHAHQGGRPPQRAAIRRRAAARPAPPPRNCTALRRGACVKSARRRRCGVREERTASGRLQLTVNSHRQTLGRAYRPHRAHRKLYRVKQPPILLRTSFSGYANFCFNLLKKFFLQFSWNWTFYKQQIR